MKKNILLTGYPRVGKTTIIKKVIARLENTGGFYTKEISEGKTRKGFKIITLQGKEGILTHRETRKGFEGHEGEARSVYRQPA